MRGAGWIAANIHRQAQRLTHLYVAKDVVPDLCRQAR